MGNTCSGPIISITASPQDILLSFFFKHVCPNSDVVPQLEYALRTFVLLYD